MAEVKITIEESRIVEAAIDRLMSCGRWEDGSEGVSDFYLRLQEKIENAVDAKVTRLLDESATAELRERVKPAIEAAVAKGFPDIDEYGQRTGVTPFDVYVRKAIDGMFKAPTSNSYSRAHTWAQEEARKLFSAHVEAGFKAEVATIQAKVRGFVDEQLAGSVTKALREAVGLR